MSANERDSDLVQDFAALREEDRRATPRWAQLRAAASRRALPAIFLWRPALALALGLAILVAALLWRAAERPIAPPGVSAGDLLAWRSPTDSLLDTPGHELLGESRLIGSALAAGELLSLRRPNDAAVESPMPRKETPR